MPGQQNIKIWSYSVDREIPFLELSARTACSFRSAQAATLLEFHEPFTNCFVCRCLCVVHDPKPPLHSHNWLSFGKFQDTERFLIHCERHFSSRLPPSGGTWNYAKASSTQKNLESFSTYWYAPFCHVCLGCCAVEFGNPGGTYKYWIVNLALGAETAMTQLSFSWNWTLQTSCRTHRNTTRLRRTPLQLHYKLRNTNIKTDKNNETLILKADKINFLVILPIQHYNMEIHNS